MKFTIFNLIDGNTVTPFGEVTDAFQAFMAQARRYDPVVDEIKNKTLDWMVRKTMKPLDEWKEPQWLKLYEKVHSAIIPGIIGKNRLEIQANEVDIPTFYIKPYKGFAGERVGVIDLDPEVLGHELCNLIRIYTYACVDKKEPEWTFYHAEDLAEDIGDDWDNLGEELQTRVEEFQRFLEINGVWWVRLVAW